MLSKFFITTVFITTYDKKTSSTANLILFEKFITTSDDKQGMCHKFQKSNYKV